MTATENIRYLVRKDIPFKGIASILLEDGTVAYTDGMTLEEYQTKQDEEFHVLSAEEMDILIDADIQGRITDAAAESEDDWNYALEVLPPARWGRDCGVEYFYVPEPIRYNLVHWHTKYHRRHFTFVDTMDISPDRISRKTLEAARQLA